MAEKVTKTEILKFLVMLNMQKTDDQITTQVAEAKLTLAIEHDSSKLIQYQILTAVPSA